MSQLIVTIMAMMALMQHVLYEVTSHHINVVE